MRVVFAAMRGVGVTVIAGAIALQVAGCSAVLYYGYPEKRTFEYERPVTVEVHASQPGAEIYGPDGERLGPAPVRSEQRVRVVRTTKRHTVERAAIGCGVDIGLLLAALAWGNADDYGTASTVGFYASLVPFAGCVALAWTKALNAAVVEPAYETIQAPPLLKAPVVTDEEVSPKSLTFEARWPDGRPASAEVTLPRERQLLLIRPEPTTFEEALILRHRAGEDFGPEGLYRLGQAYRGLVAEGNERAAALAVEVFERYLRGDALPAERRSEVEELVAELRRSPAGGGPPAAEESAPELPGLDEDAAEESAP